MPEIRKVCDVYQGYSFRKDRQTTIGYITALTIGDTNIPADQKCSDPLSPGKEITVVAVLGDVMWELGATDAVYFSGQVSVVNRQNVAGLIYNSLVNVFVTFRFDVYEYDPVAKAYFKAFTSGGATMNGLLEKRGEDYNLSVADDPSTEVQSPENYTFSIGIKPQPSAQSLAVCTSDGKSVAKAWGLRVS